MYHLHEYMADISAIIRKTVPSNSIPRLKDLYEGNKNATLEPTRNTA